MACAPPHPRLGPGPGWDTGAASRALPFPADDNLANRVHEPGGVRPVRARGSCPGVFPSAVSHAGAWPSGCGRWVKIPVSTAQPSAAGPPAGRSLFDDAPPPCAAGPNLRPAALSRRPARPGRPGPMDARALASPFTREGCPPPFLHPPVLLGARSPDGRRGAHRLTAAVDQKGPRKRGRAAHRSA